MTQAQVKPQEIYDYLSWSDWLTEDELIKNITRMKMIRFPERRISEDDVKDGLKYLEDIRVIIGRIRKVDKYGLPIFATEYKRCSLFTNRDGGKRARSNRKIIKNLVPSLSSV